MTYLDRLDGVKAVGQDRYMAFCPAHDDGAKHGKRGGQSLSVGIGIGDDGKDLFCCFAGCTYEAIIEALGGVGRNVTPTPSVRPPQKSAPQPTKPAAPVVKTTRYEYRDETGQLIYTAIRRDLADGTKKIHQERADGVKSLEGVTRLPYNLPALALAPLDALIPVVEGEKCADALADLLATTNSEGAEKWRPELNHHFEGRNVVIIPDNDDAGRRHRDHVAGNLYGTAASVRVLELPGLPHKGDVVDWLAAGHTVEELAALMETAPLWQPPRVEDPSAEIIALRAQLAAAEAKAARAEAQAQEAKAELRGLWDLITNPGHEPAARIVQAGVLRHYSEQARRHKVYGTDKRAPIVIEHLAEEIGMHRKAVGQWVVRGHESEVWRRHEGPKVETDKTKDYRPLSVAPAVKGTLAEMLEAASRTVDQKKVERGKYHPRKVKCPDCRSEDIALEKRHVCRGCQHVFDEEVTDANPPVETVGQNVPLIPSSLVGRNVTDSPVAESTPAQPKQQPLRINPEPIEDVDEFDPWRDTSWQDPSAQHWRVN